MIDFMFLSVASIFFAFAFGGLGGHLHASHRPPLLINLSLGTISLGGYFLLIFGFPFIHVILEIPMVLAATFAAAWPMQIIPLLNEKYPPKNLKGKIPVVGILGMLTLLICIAGIMSTLLSRMNYALWLRWECDGLIIERTNNKSNHNAPVLVVKTDRGNEWFENVDQGLWNACTPGSRLSKVAGSPMALLDGKRVRMVPLQINWWNDPP